ncbi:unnamed protein product [Euphydryas editha]|uniref:Uncharacterized protein n=1 Tax=Euphydryas editha TaxID=104508 RepID=A0AAU9VAQ9_EUPED|nr:unnamed protein product [Euphydryas editha]
MKRFGQESPVMDLCMNHTIQLAVMDVMYRQIDDYETDASSNSGLDYDLEDDFCVTDELENATNKAERDVFIILTLLFFKLSPKTTTKEK